MSRGKAAPGERVNAAEGTNDQHREDTSGRGSAPSAEATTPRKWSAAEKEAIDLAFKVFFGDEDELGDEDEPQQPEADQGTKSTYGPRTIKRSRRTKAQMQELDDALFEIVRELQPITVRGTFYQATVKKLVPKEEKHCKAIGQRLVMMRRKHRVPFAWIADNTRWIRRVRSYNSPSEALAETALTYRKSAWADADARVEIWCEKDALAGVLSDVTYEWDVPLMVVRGSPSWSYLYTIAEEQKEAGVPIYIYYFGDRDPAGLRIPKFIKKALAELGPDCDIRFELAAVTDEQIRQWNLPTRPTKKTDPDAKKFKGPNVELDSINPDRLRALVEKCITRHFSPRQLAVIKAAEKSEREIMLKWAKKLGKAV